MYFFIFRNKEQQTTTTMTTTTTTPTAKITTSDRSQIARIANALHYQKGLSLSAAWSKAWKAYRIKKAMRTGTASFTYTKADGTARQATGTTSAELTGYTSKGSTANYSPVNIRYYDLDKGAFRQFAADRIQ